MLWLTWRQHRAQILVTAALLLGVGVALLIHGWTAADALASAGCPTPSPECAAVRRTMPLRYRQMDQFIGWLPLAPALIGMFWGAPLLAREFERGTHLLTWTQSVSRRRWLATKFGGLGAVVALGGLVLGGMVAAWLRVFRDAGVGDAFGNRGTFSIVGVVPAAWWLFFFVLGATAGVVSRRTLPAMVVAMAVFAVTLFGLFSARDHYATPERAVKVSVTDSQVPLDAVLTGFSWIDRDGATLTSGAVDRTARTACPELGERQSPEQCLYGQGLRQVVDFHSPSRFWRFQWTETGLLLTGAALLATVAVALALRRRA